MASRIARGDIRLYQFAPPDTKRLGRSADVVEASCGLVAVRGVGALDRVKSNIGVSKAKPITQFP